jgi:hypothetical protein
MADDQNSHLVTVYYPEPFSGSFEGRVLNRSLSICKGGTSVKSLRAAWLHSLGLSDDPEEPEQSLSTLDRPVSCTE